MSLTDNLMGKDNSFAIFVKLIVDINCSNLTLISLRSVYKAKNNRNVDPLNPLNPRS